MQEYIAFDSHKRYTWVEHEQVAAGRVRQYRLPHAPGAICKALAGCEPDTAVAIEATANWYWIVEEIEQAGLQPRLVHPRKAKLMMGLVNKTDRLDDGRDFARRAAGAERLRLARSAGAATDSCSMPGKECRAAIPVGQRSGVCH